MDGSTNQLPAQVMKNLATIPLFVYANPNTFVTVHERFSPAEVIFRENVHILYINSKQAAFIEVDESVDIMNVRKHPIFFLAQNEHAKKLIILPLQVFEDLVEKLDVSDRKVVWFFHSTRCGSTAWAQVFHALPNWTVYSEPQCIYYTSLYSDHGFPSVQQFAESDLYSRYVTLMIKYSLATMPEHNNVFWKGTIMDENLIPVIAKQFPHHKILFGYRDILPNAVSFHNITTNFPAAPVVMRCTLNQTTRWDHRQLSIIRVLNANLTNGISKERCDAIYKQVQIQHVFERIVFMLAAKISLVKQFAASGVEVKFVKYEDLMADERRAIVALFTYVGVARDMVDIAWEALQGDSQAGSSISRENRSLSLGRRFNKGWQRTDEGLERCNKILRLFNLPQLDSSLQL